jgi:hypothetical protein
VVVNPPAATSETPSTTAVQSEVVIATSVVESPAAPSSTLSSTVVADSGGSPTASGPASGTSSGPALQTVAGAAGLSMNMARCVAVAALIALAVFAL